MDNVVSFMAGIATYMAFVKFLGPVYTVPRGIDMYINECRYKGATDQELKNANNNWDKLSHDEKMAYVIEGAKVYTYMKNNC